MRPGVFLISIFSSCCSLFVHGQVRTLNVHHLNSSMGLADGIVRSIGQDKYGYLWMCSLSGLSRFNGYQVKVFQNDPGEKTGIPSGQVLCVFCDKAGRLWFGFTGGLYRFEYDNSHFIAVKELANTSVFKILQTGDGKMVMVTGRGLVIYDPLTSKTSFVSENITNGKDLVSNRISDIALSGQKVYLATNLGIVIYDLLSESVRLITAPVLPGSSINKLAIGRLGTVWATYRDQDEYLFKTDTLFRNYEICKQSFPIISGQNSPVSDLMIDSRERLWCATTQFGISEYINGKLVRHVNDPSQGSSLSINHFNVLFEDKSGFIWAGTEGYGVDYFHPYDNLFSTITPTSYDPQVRMSNSWARTVIEDRDGALWMGWADGLLKQDANAVTSIQNQEEKIPMLHSNSIRSLLADDNGDIWIGTSQGVNKYQKSTGKILFYDENDSLPRQFYWSMLKDSRGNIWFGSNRSLHYYNAADKKIYSSSSHPILAPTGIQGVHSMIEDSHSRIWFGTNGGGLFVFDPVKNTVRGWQRTNENDSTLLGNTITSIAEDKNGIIWVSSFLGIVSYDPIQDHFEQYTAKRGLPSVKTSCLVVDDNNRLWIGSTSGLIMLDSNRSFFKQFNLHDGLPVMEFNDQVAYRLRSGKFVFPSLKGFVVFDPKSYTASLSNIQVYLSAVKVYDKNLILEKNYEEVEKLRLKYDQNFFSLELAALNFMNPQQTWYAYKLDGFDKDWVYTQDRLINYTNVPGGSYQFQYKATTDPNNWNVPVKSLSISIGTVFYKTIWFWLLTAILIIVLLYWFYRNRLHHEQQMHRLQTKAQSLEKEKTLVMYENLKQHLNPHFLFNSLTSLSSLIRLDQGMAGDFLDKMSKVYRYILKNRDNETVPLVEELKFVSMYIQLQKTRFEEGIDARIEVSDEYYHRKIASVTLQNLVENAIKHNIADIGQPLQIRLFIEDDYMIVQNSLQRKSFVETSNKQGLANMVSLYRYLSDRPVIIAENESHFTVKIPLI